MSDFVGTDKCKKCGRTVISGHPCTLCGTLCNFDVDSTMVIDLKSQDNEDPQMANKMSLERATEILKIDCAGSGEYCSGCLLSGMWKTTECVDVVIRAHQIVIADYQRREKEAREAALTLADSYIGMNHRLHDYAEFVYATDIEDDEEFAFALATLEKFGDRNGME